MDGSVLLFMRIFMTNYVEFMQRLNNRVWYRHHDRRGSGDHVAARERPLEINLIYG